MLHIESEHCFHCNTLVEEKGHTQHLLGEEREFCCPGCLSVADAIVENGLQDYYTYRTEVAEKSDLVPEQLRNTFALYDSPELQEDFVSKDDKLSEIQLTIEGINCPACGWLIEKQLIKHHAIAQVGVNVSAHRATIKWNAEVLPLSSILSAIETIGYKALPFSPDKHEQIFQSEHKKFLKKLGLAGIMTMQVMMLAFALYFGVFGNLDEETKQFLHWVSLVLTTPVVIYSGSVFVSSALNGLAAKQLNMDLPISIAILTTFAGSAWSTFDGQGEVFFESICMFIFLLLIGRLFEHKGREKALEISNNLINVVPVKARLISEEQVTTEVPAKVLKSGQLHQVLTGEQFPVDGEIINGATEANEAIITGESLPIPKPEGSTVIGGSINVAHPTIVRASNSLKDSTINRIVKLQELALSSKPKIALTTDKFSSYFVSVVLLISLCTYIFWSINAPSEALWITVSVLVATCPCALGLATPTAFSCAMAQINKLGFLIKKADALEQINNIDRVVFDKTGTLTIGSPQLSGLNNYSEFSDNKILDLAAALENNSEHPIAKAFKQPTILKAEEVEVTIGSGITGTIQGTRYFIGKLPDGAANLNSISVTDDVYLAAYSTVTKEPSKVSILAGFTLVDEIKPGAFELLASLDKESVLLSGDHLAKVTQTANALGIKSFFAQQSPIEKLTTMRNLQEQHSVMMVGDGVNDGPVMASANVSVAVTGASDFAQASADVVMVASKIEKLKDLFSVSKDTIKTVKQNIGWAVGYNLLVLPFAVSGWLAPWVAVIGMSLSSIIVTYNSTRLIKN